MLFNLGYLERIDLWIWVDWCLLTGYGWWLVAVQMSDSYGEFEQTFWILAGRIMGKPFDWKYFVPGSHPGLGMVHTHCSSLLHNKDEIFTVS